METKKTDNLSAINISRSFGELKRPVSPRFINKRQNLYEVYKRNNPYLVPRQIGSQVLAIEMESQDRVSPIDLTLPGGQTEPKYKLVVKKPKIPFIRKWGLRLAFSCMLIALISVGLILDQGYKDLHKIMKQKSKVVTVVQTKESSNITKPHGSSAPILVLNGTNTQGLAADTESVLKQAGFNVIGAANAPTTDYTQTVILDLSKESNSYTERYLEQRYNTIAITSFPGNSIQTNGAAFVIILGSNETINSQS